MLQTNDRSLVPDSVQSPGDVPALQPLWNDLAARALVPAGLNHRAIAEALLRAKPLRSELSLVRQGRELLFALLTARRSFPAPVITNWITPLSFMGLPHVDGTRPVPAIETFLAAADRPVVLRSIPADGPFWNSLQKAAGHFAILDRWERAALRFDGDFENWFASNFERKRRKEFRRLRTRLAERGRLSFEALGAGEWPGGWIDELLALEASGWKGRRGTALARDPAMAAALHAMAKGLACDRALRMWRLSLDGRAVATMFAVTEGSEVWLGKIAFDEAFAAYSPGVLLVLEVTAALFAEGGMARADSCAVAGHPMIDRIWRGRIAMADVIVADAALSPVRFAATVAAERAYRRSRRFVAGLYRTFTGSKTS